MVPGTLRHPFSVTVATFKVGQGRVASNLGVGPVVPRAKAEIWGLKPGGLPVRKAASFHSLLLAHGFPPLFQDLTRWRAFVVPGLVL